MSSNSDNVSQQSFPADSSARSSNRKSGANFSTLGSGAITANAAGAAATSNGFRQTFKKALTAGSVWEDKEEFLDVVYWLRQAVGIVLGLSWGALAIQGAAGIILFALLNAAALYLYTSGFQSVDEEEFGGLWELTKEGFVTSSATFLVAWIVVYTSFHSPV